jgi:hypothetical protein
MISGGWITLNRVIPHHQQVTMGRLKQVFSLPHLVILTPFLLLSPVFLTGRALFWGTPALQFVPWRAWAWETLRSGHLPLWNPLLGMGAPLLANYQLGFFYPPNWAYFFLAALGGVPAMAWGQALLVALHLAWAGWGMVRLTRQLGVGELGQTIGGLAFGLSGYLVARSGFLSINAAVAWLPWILLGVDELIAETRAGVGRGGRSRWRLALVVGLQLLAGHAQTCWYTWLLAWLWGGVRWWQVDRGKGSQEAEAAHSQYPRVPLKNNAHSHLLRALSHMITKRRSFQFFACLLLAFGLGFGLAAVQLLPTGEYLLNSSRAAAVDYDQAMTYSLWPWRLLTLVSPDLFGNPAQGDYWGYGNYWEDALYIGLLPLLLAIRGLWKGGRLARALFGLAIAAILLALGKNLPLFPWLYAQVPTFDLFQAPTRWSIWTTFALAMLAALGADRWLNLSSRGRYVTRLAITGAIGVTLGAWLTRLLRLEINLTFVRSTILTGVWAAGIGILALTRPVNSSRRCIWSWVVALFVALDLLVAGWGLNPGVDLDFYGENTPQVEQVKRLVGDGRLYLPPEDERRLKFERFFRFDTFYPSEDWRSLREVLLPNLTLLDGIPSANNFDPLVPRRFALWMERLAQADETVRYRLLPRMGVSVVETIDPSQPGGIRFKSVQGWRRWWWADCARYADSLQEALELVFEGQQDAEAGVVLEAGNPAEISACKPGQVNVIELLRQEPNRVIFGIESKTPGWLVMADTWYPGWVARVDGRRTEIFPAEGLFRAVAVPAGRHTVELAYRPLSFYLGAGISLMAWILMLVKLNRSNPLGVV